MDEGVQSWSGEGVGTDRASFLAKISEQLPEYDPAELVEAVFCQLRERLSGGTVERLVEQLSTDTRPLVAYCKKMRTEPAHRGDRDDFYLGVAEHLNIPPERVRLVLHVVYAALHSQLTEAISESVAAELPDDLSGTWVAARHNVPAPR